MPTAPKILIVAAEESSAHYGLRLLELWKKKRLTVEAFGVGNRAMEKAGFEILGRSEELAVFGLFEIWNHWPQIKAAFHKVVESARTRGPDLILLMDYPGFNFRLAKKLKPLGIPIVYFIPPQVWAWKQGRVKFLRKMIDENLVHCPFEQEFYKTHKVPTHFVGHPLLDDLSEQLLTVETQRLNRRRFGISDEKIVLGIMPGSREGELRMNLNTQIETAQLLHNEIPNLSVVLLVAPNIEKDKMSERLPAVHFPLTLVKGEPFEMIGMTDVILATSGTATLMVALMEKPLVIIYKMNALSAAIGRRVMKARFFGLINMIMGYEIAPERFQEQATPRHLADLLKPWLTDEKVRHEKALELRQIKSKLGEKGAIERVSSHIEKYFVSRDLV